MPVCLVCGTFTGSQTWKTLCWYHYKLSKRAGDTAPESHGIPEDKLRRLILLCHPDKHGNSETATEITTWLLSLRRSK